MLIDEMLVAAITIKNNYVMIGSKGHDRFISDCTRTGTHTQMHDAKTETVNSPRCLFWFLTAWEPDIQLLALAFTLCVCMNLI